jgi:uncharacterized membrane protein (DUF4010 family)
MPEIPPHLEAFLTSLAVGLLIGLERERNPAARAGLRTFALVSLLGTLCAMLSAETQVPWILAAGLGAVGVLIVAAYVGASTAEADRGTTTQAALLVDYGFGAMIWYGYSTQAIMLAIIVTMMLYFKPELHGISQRMERRDLISIFQFAVLTFIILPILPDQGYGPHLALNPYNIWLMVVLLSGISLTGYVALRLWGHRYGAPLLGILGGLVSSTATTVIYARHGRENEGMGQLAVLVILLANLVVLLRLAVIGALVAPEILPGLLPVLSGGLVLGLAGTATWWKRLQQKRDLPIPEIKNPAELRTSLTFGVVYALVLFFAAWLSDYAGNKGLYAVAVVSGLTEMDAITLSSLRLFILGKLHTDQAVTAITLALIANVAFKFGVVLFFGGPGLARRCAAGLAAVAVGAAAVLVAI